MTTNTHKILIVDDEPGILDTLGWIHYRMGDLNQARSLLVQEPSALHPKPM